MRSTDIDAPAKSRRAVVKAAAWSVPVIAAAVAAPAASASLSPIDPAVPFSFTGECGPAGAVTFILTAGSAAINAGTQFYFAVWKVLGDTQGGGTINSVTSSSGELVELYFGGSQVNYSLANDLGPSASIIITVQVTLSETLVKFTAATGVTVDHGSHWEVRGVDLKFDGDSCVVESP